MTEEHSELCRVMKNLYPDRWEKKLCYKQRQEIEDECLDCDFHLDCFPMEEESSSVQHK